MTGTAITFMIISMVLVWGGLAVSTWSLFRHPEDIDDEPLPPVEL
ncbi:MAG: methionine/alanine import family NSS transporter small subunit [Arthrobacter sp.]|jgi:hypothetical protein|nr:methionine/alanine import family NSS transporter small subunit [Arthrobacter sp.]